MSLDKLIECNFVMFEYSGVQYTQLCRFREQLILKAASSNLAMKFGSDSLPSHMF
jgi:hypothetical protein